MTSQANKEMIKALLYMHDILDKFPFIKVSKLDVDDMLYTSFKGWVQSQSKTGGKTFDGINVNDWLTSHSKYNAFKKDFEDEIYDAVCMMDQGYGSSVPDFLGQMSDFIKGRQRQFTFGKNQSQFERFLSALKSINMFPFYPKLMDEH